MQQEFSPIPFHIRKKPEEYKRLPYLFKLIQDLEPKAKNRLLMEREEFFAFACSILSRIDLFELHLMSEDVIRSMLEAQGIFTEEEKDILFIRDVSYSAWYQIEQRLSHSIVQYVYAESCKEQTLTDIFTQLDIIKLCEEEMFQLLKAKNISGLILFFENLNKIAEEFSTKVEQMIADSQFSEDEKQEHTQRIRKKLGEIKEITDLVNAHLSYTRIATKETKEIIYQPAETVS